jgi:hypothetical protein
MAGNILSIYELSIQLKLSILFGGKVKITPFNGSIFNGSRPLLRGSAQLTVVKCNSWNVLWPDFSGTCKILLTPNMIVRRNFGNPLIPSPQLKFLIYDTEVAGDVWKEDKTQTTLPAKRL